MEAAKVHLHSGVPELSSTHLNCFISKVACCLKMTPSLLTLCGALEDFIALLVEVNSGSTSSTTSGKHNHFSSTILTCTAWGWHTMSPFQTELRRYVGEGRNGLIQLEWVWMRMSGHARKSETIRKMRAWATSADAVRVVWPFWQKVLFDYSAYFIFIFIILGNLNHTKLDIDDVK